MPLYEERRAELCVASETRRWSAMLLRARTPAVRCADVPVRSGHGWAAALNLVNRLAERSFSELRQLEHPWCLARESFRAGHLQPAATESGSVMSNITRRQFLEDSILAAAAAVIASMPTPATAAEQRPVSA